MVLCPWNFSGKNTGVGCHFLLQGIFLIQDLTRVSCIAGRFLTNWATRKALKGFKAGIVNICGTRLEASILPASTIPLMSACHHRQLLGKVQYMYVRRDCLPRRAEYSYYIGEGQKVFPVCYHLLMLQKRESRGRSQNRIYIKTVTGRNRQVF